MKYPRIPDGLEAVTRIRYKDDGALSRLSNKGDRVEVEFFANVKGVAPGQSAVFYEGDDVVGGGIIYGSFLSPSQEN
jgi:tRNA-uridine 2-sulfurtransferase